MFYCQILRGTLAHWSVCFYWNYPLELRLRSTLRDNFLRNSSSECIIEFIIRKLLGVFFRKTQKFSFISRYKHGSVSYLLLRRLNCITTHIFLFALVVSKFKRQILFWEPNGTCLCTWVGISCIYFHFTNISIAL